MSDKNERTDDDLTDDDELNRDDSHVNDQDDSDDDDNEELGEKGRDALRKERKARREAEKERNAFKRELEALRKAAPKTPDKSGDDTDDDDDVMKTLNAYKSRIDNIESLLTQKQGEEARERIAKDHGIPAEFVKHLKGDTDEELEEGAKALVALLKSKNIETDAGERTPRKTAKVDREKLADPARWGLRR